MTWEYKCVRWDTDFSNPETVKYAEKFGCERGQMKAFEDRLNLEGVQGWELVEHGPLGALFKRPRENLCGPKCRNYVQGN